MRFDGFAIVLGFEDMSCLGGLRLSTRDRSRKHRMKMPPEGGGNMKMLERETRFELATSTLARLHSTTELFPHESTV